MREREKVGEALMETGGWGWGGEDGRSPNGDTERKREVGTLLHKD